jgi:methylphosphotriester-DNA--protein-cysteine methyltransferase
MRRADHDGSLHSLQWDKGRRKGKSSRYAAHLLATTTDAVVNIAELSGFSRSSFFRIFSNAYGMSPSDYRRVARK